MLVLEHDAKELLSARGITVPDGALLQPGGPLPPDLSPPWVVKAQVPVGGRGKAGGIQFIEDESKLAGHLDRLYGLSIKGHPVRELRIEQAIADAQEVYLGLTVDPASASVTVMVSARGGVDVEDHAGSAMRSARAEPELSALETAFDGLIADLPQHLRSPVRDAATRLARAFLDLDALLLEVNPLFVDTVGNWVAGDVRLFVDDNAFARQPDLSALLERRRAAYPDAAFKRSEGYDLVVVDPDGDIGLVTTGAGLSMKLIDEMTEAGARPYNFCDIRSGQMRGDPARLIGALRRVAEGRNMRCILVNIFAGITDLGEFAELLITAVRALPDLNLPLVVRLVGNGQERAEALLRAAGLELTIENDLTRAVAIAVDSARHAND